MAAMFEQRKVPGLTPMALRGVIGQLVGAELMGASLDAPERGAHRAESPLALASIAAGVALNSAVDTMSTAILNNLFPQM